MTTYKELCARAGELAKLLKPASRAAIPDEMIREAAEAVASLTDRLALFLPPSAGQKRAAKSHPAAVQIAKLTMLDPKRKRFFNVTYFQRKFAELPPDRSVVSAKKPSTAVAARDAVILYCYRAEKAGRGLSLEKLRAELESDYQESPEAVAERRARGLLRELMCIADVEELTARLASQFPDEKDLKAFAKITSLAVPSPRKSGKVRKSGHQRLAEEIHQKGAVARLDLAEQPRGKGGR